MLQSQLIDLEKKTATKNLSYYEERTADLVECCRELIKEEIDFFFSLHYKSIPLVSQLALNNQLPRIKKDFYQYLLVPRELTQFMERLGGKLKREIDAYFCREVTLIYQEKNWGNLDQSLTALEENLRTCSENLFIVDYLEKNLDSCCNKLFDSLILGKWAGKILAKPKWGQKILAWGEVSKEETQERYLKELNSKIKGLLDNLKWELTYHVQREVTQKIYDLQDKTIESLAVI